jgi:hypothetical protein
MQQARTSLLGQLTENADIRPNIIIRRLAAGARVSYNRRRRLYDIKVVDVDCVVAVFSDTGTRVREVARPSLRNVPASGSITVMGGNRRNGHGFIIRKKRITLLPATFTQQVMSLISATTATAAVR